MGTRLIAPVVLALGLALFVPDDLLHRLGLLSLRQQYQPYLGAAFLLSSCILVCRGAVAAFGWIQQHAGEYQRLRRARAGLHRLSTEEQDLLRGYLEGQTKTLAFPLSSGVAAGLRHTGVIYRSADLGRGGGFSFDHNIQPWAWKYLHKHPELVRFRAVGGSSSTPRV